VANIYTQTEFNPTQTELIQSHEVLSLTNENPGSLIKWYSQSRSGIHNQEVALTDKNASRIRSLKTRTFFCQ